MLLTKTKRDNILAPLQSVSGIVERRHTLPILSNVLIEKKGSTLTLLATDIEIQIRTSCAVEDGPDAAITVGARKLLDILRSLPEDEVSLVLDEKKLTVKAGKSRFSLQTLPSDDFPRMSLPHGESSKFSISQIALKRLLGQTQYAMASQDVRYYLNGLLFVVDKDQLKAVATDGHRLAFAAMNIELGSSSRHEVIIPRKTVLELNRLLSDTEDEVDIELAANQIRFKFNHVELVSKLIDGKFPDFERVVPPSTKNNFTVSRSTMQQAMQRAAILTNEKFRGVRLVITNDSVKIVAANADQEEAQDEVEIQYAGDPLDIGFNVAYLLDVLSNTSAEMLEWGFNDNNSSALVTIPGNNSYKYVVMPMRI